MKMINYPIDRRSSSCFSRSISRRRDSLLAVEALMDMTMTQGEICNVSVPHSVNVSMIPNNDRMFGRFMPVLWEKDHMYESQRLYTSNKAVIQATLKGSQAQQMLCLRANQQQQKHIPLLGGKEFYHPSSNSYNCEPTVM